MAEVSSWVIRLAILPFFGALGDMGVGRVYVFLVPEPNRLNAMKRLLVFLAVDGVSFVISCCKAS